MSPVDPVKDVPHNTPSYLDLTDSVTCLNTSTIVAKTWVTGETAAVVAVAVAACYHLLFVDPQRSGATCLVRAYVVSFHS